VRHERHEQLAIAFTNAEVGEEILDGGRHSMEVAKLTMVHLGQNPLQNGKLLA
jgi:hypothetical protein